MKVSRVVVISFDHGPALKIYKAAEFIRLHVSETFAKNADIKVNSDLTAVQRNADQSGTSQHLD